MTKITFWIATKITTLEREKYLYEAIESILSQSNSNWELIISDDNSDIKVNYEKYKDDRIKIFYQKESLWIFKNFNFCLQKSETELFLPLWDDDLLEKNFVEEILNFYYENKDKNLDLICFNYSFIKSNWLEYFKSNIKTQYFQKWEEFLNDSVKELYTSKLTKMFFCSVVNKKSLLKIWGYPDFWMVTDTYLVYYFSVNFNFWFCEKNLIKIRHHNQNASWINNIDLLREEQIKLNKIIKTDFYWFLNDSNKLRFNEHNLELFSDHIALFILFKKYWRIVSIKDFLNKKITLRRFIVFLLWLIFWKQIHFYFRIFIIHFNKIKYIVLNLFFNK